MKPPLLLVEDDSGFRRVYGGVLRGAGYEVIEAADRAAAREAFAARPFPVVLLDLMLPPDGTAAGGLALLAELLSARPSTKVLVCSGAGDGTTMVGAVRAGAFDYLEKPVDPDVLLIVVERAAARVALEDRVESLTASLSAARPADGLVGESAPFRAAVSLAERIAPSDLPVLVTGENGTGKELLARAIHRRSRRAERPFVAVNCGALPEALLESALFGHVKGAFTGALRDHHGLFREADGGTLFLDELGDMPPPLQVKLLRALEAGEVLPVGADRPVKVDVRIVSATHQDLAALQAKGAFREDLYWRLKGAEVRLPPLRERKADLPLLAAHFLNQAASLAADGKPKVLGDAAVEALLAHPWPGNLRELRHELQRATVLAGERRQLEPEDLSFAGAEPAPRPAGAGTTLAEKVEALERRELAAALEKSGGNRTRAAEALGLSRQGLLKKLDRYGLG